MSEYFKESEFACKCGCGFCEPDARLLETLDAIRKVLDRPVVVTSGCRCETHNAAVGGVPDSNHTHRTAADIQCPGVGAESVWLTIMRLYAQGKIPLLAGLGRYDTFNHVDVEPKRGRALRRWDERKRK
jgi:uncharacterized protein YcbK (DUF882 family)